MNAASLRAPLAAVLFACTWAARAGDVPPAASAGRPLRVVVTVFPVWDWVRQVAGSDPEGIEISLLPDGGADLHSRQPSARDLKTIGECDLFVYVGGESDDWVAPALEAAPNPDRRVLDLVGALGGDGKAEEAVEGAEIGPSGDGGPAAVDEHVWLSLRLARKLVGAIADALSGIDPARAETYRANAAAYRAGLAALDGEYAAAVAAAPRRTLVVADRFPLRYLADDYGLACYAAFPGCSAETEASFKTVVFLARKADETGAKALLVMEGRDHRVAEAVRAAAKTENLSVVSFDSLQSSAASRAAAGETYLGAMRRNLAALSAALQ